MRSNNTAYRELLEFCEFSDSEIEEFLPVWEEGCRQFGLAAADIDYALHKYMPQYWDLSLRGVRLCIGAFIREIIEMFRIRSYVDRGDAVIYCNMPVHPACVCANKIAGGEHLHICQPDFLIASVLEPLFSRRFSASISDISCLSGDCMHCEMNRYRIEAQMSGVLPAPSVTWNWGLFCNEGPKSEEYLSIMDDSQGWNYVVTTFPHDAGIKTREAEDDGRVAYLAGRLRESQKELTRYTGIEVSDDNVRQALNGYMRFVSKLEVLTDLVCKSDPQPISCNDFTLLCALQHAAVNIGVKYFEAALDALIEEVQERVSRGQGILPKGSAKVACHFTPYCIPWFEKAFRENGIAVSYSLFFGPASKQLRCGEDEDVYKTIVRHWLTNPSAVNMGDESEMIVEMLDDNPVDGVIYGFFSFDRWIGGIQKTMAKIVEDRTGISHYYIEGDFWNDSKYTLEERLSRIENICYHIRIKQLINGD